MSKTRLEAFSDGVLAILITIMVFDIKPPTGSTVEAALELAPLLLTYLLSFIYLGIYWSNHHHMLHVAERIDGAVLWANLHLLFWLSLLPFATNWLRVSDFRPLSVAIYGVVLFCSAIAYLLLQGRIIHADGPESCLRAAIGIDLKGKISVVLYCLGIGLSFVRPELAMTAYVIVSLMWLVPDSRIESKIHTECRQQDPPASEER